MKFNKEKLAKIAWNMIDGEFGILPPDNNEMIEVMDAESNKARAIPCYHNFKIVDGRVAFGESKFDGWMIQVDNLTPPEIGKIKYWRIKNGNRLEI